MKITKNALSFVRFHVLGGESIPPRSVGCPTRTGLDRDVEVTPTFSELKSARIGKPGLTEARAPSQSAASRYLAER
jgi:hypothetical protein